MKHAFLTSVRSIARLFDGVRRQSKLIVTAAASLLLAAAPALHAQAAGTLDAFNSGLAGGYLPSITTLADGKLIVTGSLYDSQGAYFSAGRFNSDGSRDYSFVPQVNDMVYNAAVQSDGKIVIVGSFTFIVPTGSGQVTRNHIARFNADGSLDNTFDPNADGEVYGAAIQPDGKVIVWGSFHTLTPNGGGTSFSRNYIARLNADGTVDAGFDPEPDSDVKCAVIQPDGRILVGGSFGEFDPGKAGATVQVPYFARLNANGTVDASFLPGPNGFVNTALVQPDGKIVLGGYFSGLYPNGNQTLVVRNCLARVNADGTPDAGFDPNANSDILTMSLQTDGKILLAGYFSVLQPNGAPTPTPRSFVARVNADGSLDQTFDPAPNAWVSSISQQADGKVLIGGNFDQLQPNSAKQPSDRMSIARLNNDAGTEVLSAFKKNKINWLRSGALPELSSVLFEASIDGGTTWSTLGAGVRQGTTSNWVFNAFLPLPNNCHIRARGVTLGGCNSGSSGLVEAKLYIGNEIDVSCLGHAIDSGSQSASQANHTDFGNGAPNGAAVIRTFKIANLGDETLNLTGAPAVAISGANAADFSVSLAPGSVVGGGASTSFEISFHPSDYGLREATVSIANDDTSENPYTFAIQGMGSSADLTSLTAGGAPLSPGFTPGTTVYTANVPYPIWSTNITAAAADPNAVIKVDGQIVQSGFSSSSIDLYPGSNMITVEVTSLGQAVKTYSLEVTRAAASGNAYLASVVPSSGTLTPAFTSQTLAYSATVGNATDLISITAMPAHPATTLWVNGNVMQPGIACNPLSLTVGDNTLFVSGVAEDGSTMATYVLTITRQASSNANLSSLWINSGSFTPSFDPGTTAYSTSVSNATMSVKVTPFTQDANASIKVNGTPLPSGAQSAPIGLSVGVNNINIVVTAQDGTQKTYVMSVTRSALSSNANLSALSTSAGALTPAFSPGTLNYAASVSTATTTATITPTRQDPGATILVKGLPVASGTPSSPISLNFGSNNINIVVSAPDGTIKNYVLNIVRTTPSSNANLASLSADIGALDPVFASATTSYVAHANNGDNAISLIPTKADAGASIKINGVTVASGSPSAPIALTSGETLVNVAVKAADGTTIKTYLVTVVKPGVLAFASPVFTVNSSDTATMADVAITRSGGAAGTVGCSLTSTNGTAKAPAQYDAQAGTAVGFANADLVQHVMIPIKAKAATTKAQAFLVTLFNASGGAGLGMQATATVVILPPSSATETKKPAVTITAPTSKAMIDDNTQVIVKGSATDNIGVHKVQVSVDNGATFADAVVAAPGTQSTTYTLPLTPKTGLNTLLVRSVDFKGNLSPAVSRSFTQLRTLTVAINGPANAGGVTPGYAPTSSRQVGKSLVITATPKPGFVFNGWTANDWTGTGVTSAQAELASLPFIMKEGLKLTATYIVNPFNATLTGGYNGLVIPSPALPAPSGTPAGNETAGLLQNLTVTSTGGFTGKLKIDGRTLSVAGKFDNAGNARFGTKRSLTQSFVRQGRPSLDVTLKLDMTGADGKLGGSVRQATYGTLAASSVIDADRAQYSKAAKAPKALAGATKQSYTLTFPSLVQSTGLAAKYYPQGDGYATMTVNVNGTLTLAGKLADHTAITASSVLSKKLQWPMFAQLYGLKGCIMGQVSIEDGSALADDVTGGLYWFRPVQQNAQWYPDGWSEGIELGLKGDRYALPAAQPVASVFPAPNPGGPNAKLSLTGGLLNTPLNLDATISPSNVVTFAPGAPATSLAITKTSGVIKGSFIHSTQAQTLYQGVILQKGTQPGAHGYFMSPSPKVPDHLGESGAVMVTAKP